MPRACPPVAPSARRTLAEVEAALDDLGAPYVVKADGLAAGKGVHRHRRPRRGARARGMLPALRCRCWSRSSSPAPRSRCSSSATATTCCRSAPPRTTSASATATPGPTPAAWARTRRSPGCRTCSATRTTFVAPRHAARSPSPSSASSMPRARRSSVCSTPGSSSPSTASRSSSSTRASAIPRRRSCCLGWSTRCPSCCWPRHPAPSRTSRVPAFADAVAVTVVLASEGYPQAPVTGRAIRGLDAAAAVDGVHIAHAATAEEGDALIATGGRVLNVVGPRHDLRRGPRPRLPRARRIDARGRPVPHRHRRSASSRTEHSAPGPVVGWTHERCDSSRSRAAVRAETRMPARFAREGGRNRFTARQATVHARRTGGAADRAGDRLRSRVRRLHQCRSGRPRAGLLPGCRDRRARRAHARGPG